MKIHLHNPKATFPLSFSFFSRLSVPDKKLLRADAVFFASEHAPSSAKILPFPMRSLPAAVPA
jgi:hypothetical protein